MPRVLDPFRFVLIAVAGWMNQHQLDRKSTRLNSSHTVISYAVFCLKKKNNIARDAGADRGRERGGANTTAAGDWAAVRARTCTRKQRRWLARGARLLRCERGCRAGA